VLADFLTAVHRQTEPMSLTTAADLLKDRYDAENALTQKIAVGDVMRLLILSGALSCVGGQPASDALLADTHQLEIETLSTACDAVYVWRLIEGGVSWDPALLAPVLYGAGASADSVLSLCDLPDSPRAHRLH
jgi:hypothetical protein